MSGPWERTKLVGRQDWSPGLMSITLDATLSGFEPGQFVSLGLDDPAGGPRVERPYSLASRPGAPPELLLNRIPQGALTPRLFDLAVGADLWITTRPGGQFTLAWVKDAPFLWMMATGTGLAPYMSMLRANQVWARFGRVILVHAVRIAAHLAYRDELTALERARDGGFSYIKVTSREPRRADTLEGRIPALLEDGSLEARARAQIEPASAQVLLSGNPDMIQQTRAHLEARGLVRNRMRAPGQITAERFW